MEDSKDDLEVRVESVTKGVAASSFETMNRPVCTSPCTASEDDSTSDGTLEGDKGGSLFTTGMVESDEVI